MASSSQSTQPDPFASSQLSQDTLPDSQNVEIEIDPSHIQVPRSRGTTPQSSQVNRLKFASPASAPTSSITPPPSTQQHHNQSIARTPSPLGLLNSPPPTTARDVSTSNLPTANEIPSHDQIANASVDDLRSMLSDLSISLREARTASAHYKLQYNMLVIDSNKAKNEMHVELAMLQRELEVLQAAEDRRQAAAVAPRQSIEASSLATIHDLTRQTNILTSENEDLRTLLSQERRTVEQRDLRIVSLEEQNVGLRHRIRQNREHLNGMLENVFDRSPTSAMNTPSRHSYYGTPRRAPVSTPAPRQVERRDNLAFDALLLADKVLSQETATAPSTPKNQGRRHVRNTHSLSSLPSTPNRRTQPGTLRTPLHLSAILEPEVPASAPHFPISTSSRRRRASSDSTITATSVEDELDQHTETHAGASQSHASQSQYEELIPESSASQAATSMLRSTPKKAKKSTQTKLTGKVTKATAPLLSTGGYPVSPEKRRMASGIPGAEIERRAGNEGSPKKRRMDHVGLGIGI
ncbi:hypothetical protein BT63DRAFT_112839 [Microthyrium microscopicum]|uniref:Uncharacterized protein n=1 Tax=Microthyrium microscopicum TaxID=703497 RepID=A0A6A6TVL3_9PEZI|nr:hypothetical protein BT63DRAFT_112839 [Microthyrium microscopicum]